MPSGNGTGLPATVLTATGVFTIKPIKPVQTAYAGFVWEPDEFARKVAIASQRRLKQLRQAPRTIPPGHYRVYLAPAALDDVLHTLAWGGFRPQKDHRTKQTTLLKNGGRRGAPAYQRSRCVRTHAMGWHQTSRGRFYQARPGDLIDAGTFRNCLVHRARRRSTVCHQWRLKWGDTAVVRHGRRGYSTPGRVTTPRYRSLYQ